MSDPIGEIKDRREFFIKCALFIILLDILTALMLSGSYEIPIPMTMPNNMFSIEGITYFAQLFGGVILFTFQMFTFTMGFNGMPFLLQGLLSVVHFAIWIGLIWSMWDPIIAVVKMMASVAKNVLSMIIPWYKPTE